MNKRQKQNNWELTKGIAREKRREGKMNQQKKRK